MSDVLYPGLRDLFAFEIARIKALGRPFSVRGAAREINVSSSTFHGWVQGSSFPEDDKHQKLANLFWPERSEEALQFRHRLAELKQSRSAVIHPEDLRTRRLKFALFDKPPFADYDRSREKDHSQGFLDRILSRVVRLADLDYEYAPDTPGRSVIQRLRDGAIDVGIGLYDLADRWDLHTFPSNCRVGFNAVFVEGDPELDPDANSSEPSGLRPIREALAQKSPVDFTPVVSTLDSESGYNFLRNVLSYRGQCERVPPLNPAAYAERLLALSRARKRPVMITDEWTALCVLSELEQLGARGILVLPLSTERAAQHAKTNFPAYTIGLVSLSVRHQDLILQVQALLSQFLRNETEYCSTCIRELYDQLTKKIEQYLSALSDRGISLLQSQQNEPCQNARLWAKAVAVRSARYICRLNETEVQYDLDYLALPWAPVIHRVLRDIGPIPEDLADPSRGRFKLGLHELVPFIKRSKEPPEKLGNNTLLGKLGFGAQILQPFSELIDLGTLQVVEMLTTSETAPNTVETQDVRVGWLATPIRATNWLQLRLPVRLSLNALMLATDFRDPQLKETNSVTDLFFPDPSRRHPDKFRFVALRGGCSSEYLQNTMGVPFEKIHLIDTLAPQQLKDSLRASNGDWTFLAMNSLEALAVQQQLGDECRIVFPPIPTATICLPSYHLCVAINRLSAPWIELFKSSWPIVIDTNTDWYVRLFVSLHGDIQRAACNRIANIRERCSEAYEQLLRGLATEDGKLAARKIADWSLAVDDEHLQGSDLDLWSTVWSKVKEKIKHTR